MQAPRTPIVRVPRPGPPRAQRRRQQREGRRLTLPYERWGATLWAALPLLLLALMQAGVWSWNEASGITRQRPEALVVYLPIVAGATVALNRSLPRWGVVWAGVALWGMVELVRQAAIATAFLIGGNSTPVTGISIVVLIAGSLGAVTCAAYLARRNRQDTMLFIGAFLMADLMGVSLEVLGASQPVTRVVVWAVVLTAAQAVAAVAVLRTALTGWWPGVWALMGLAVLSPLAALSTVWSTGLRFMEPGEALLAWWPMQAGVLLAVGALLRWRGPKGSGEHA